MILTHDEEGEQHGGEDGHAVEHEGKVVADLVEVFVVLDQHRGQQEARGHAQL